MIDSTPANIPNSDRRTSLATTKITNELATAIRGLANGFKVNGPTEGSGRSLVMIVQAGSVLAGDSGNATGFYSGTSVDTSQGSYDSSGPIVAADVGTSTVTGDVVLVNPQEIAGGPPLQSGSYVSALWVGDDEDGKPVGLVVNAPRSGAQFFRLTQNGGVAGTVSQTCTFTYDVYGFYDSAKTVKLATAVALTGSGNRIAAVKYISASYGGGLYDPAAISGTNNPSGIVLLWTDERPDPRGC